MFMTDINMHVWSSLAQRILELRMMPPPNRVQPVDARSLMCAWIAQISARLKLCCGPDSPCESQAESPGTLLTLQMQQCDRRVRMLYVQLNAVLGSG